MQVIFSDTYIAMKNGQAFCHLAGNEYLIHEDKDLLYIINGEWAIFFGPEDSARIRAIIRSLRHIEELNARAFSLN